MKRTPLARRTPLQRGKPLRRSGSLKRGAGLKPGKPIARRARLRPVNRERKLERYEQNFGERAEIIRAMPCLLLGNECSGPIEAAHVRSRGAGGTRRDLVPLCSKHHEEQHRLAVELDERRVP